MPLSLMSDNFSANFCWLGTSCLAILYLKLTLSKVTNITQRTSHQIWLPSSGKTIWKLFIAYVKVKEFTLKQVMQAQKGVEVELYSFFNLGARWGWVVNATRRPLYPWEICPMPIGQKAGCAPEPVWMGAENLSPTAIRFSDRSARGKSLYRLLYPNPLLSTFRNLFMENNKFSLPKTLHRHED